MDGFSGSVGTGVLNAGSGAGTDVEDEDDEDEEDEEEDAGRLVSPWSRCSWSARARLRAL